MEQHWYIKHCRLFEQLTADQLGRLERRARMRRFPKKSAVYLPSDTADGVFLVADGRIKLSTLTSDGKEAILAFVEAGEIFGELSLVGEAVRDEHAEAVLDSTVVVFPVDALEALMADSAPLTLSVTKLIGWRRKRVERRLRTLLFRPNRERVIHLLLDLAEQYGQSTPEGVLLAIKLSHQDLASIIGATRETVTVLLGELQLDGMLKVSRQRLVISDLPRLAGCVDAASPKLPERSVFLARNFQEARRAVGGPP
ncbi:MAG: Crp/Fnr family transcriptional regulator [Planctomycetaceae bacterium]